MTNREFDFHYCPWCGSPYEHQCILKVQSDQIGPCRLFLQCGGCGSVYRVDRKVIWQAEAVGKVRIPELNVVEFLEDREKRIVDAWRKLRGIPNH